MLKAFAQCSQEKLDHLGIVALVVGTPLTALMAREHGEIPLDVKICFGAMLAAALLSPAARVAGFTIGTVAMFVLHWHEVMNLNLGVQLALYGLAAVFFLRCGQHRRLKSLLHDEMNHAVAGWHTSDCCTLNADDGHKQGFPLD